MLMEGSGIRELAERASEQLAGTPNDTSQPAAAAETVAAFVEADPPLSHGQQCSGTHTSSRQTGAAYHIPGAATVRAELDIERLPAGVPACHRPPGRLADHFRRRRRKAGDPTPRRRRTLAPRGRMAPDRGRRGL